MSLEIKVIQPSGVLDSISGSQLRREIGDVVKDKSGVVLIDCQAVSFMDSSGLGALVMALKKVREAGGRLSICSMNDQMRMLFELTAMDSVFEIFSNQDEFNRTVLS